MYIKKRNAGGIQTPYIEAAYRPIRGICCGIGMISLPLEATGFLGCL